MKGKIPQKDDYPNIKQGGTDHAEAFYVAEELAQTSQRELQHILITDGEPHKATSLCKSKGITPSYDSACASSLGSADKNDCLCAVHFAKAFNNKYNTIVGAVANKNHVCFTKLRLCHIWVATDIDRHVLAQAFVKVSQHIQTHTYMYTPPAPYAARVNSRSSVKGAVL